MSLTANIATNHQRRARHATQDTFYSQTQQQLNAYSTAINSTYLQLLIISTRRIHRHVPAARVKYFIVCSVTTQHYRPRLCVQHVPVHTFCIQITLV